MTFQGSRKCTPGFGCRKPLSLRQRIGGFTCQTDLLSVEDGLDGSVSFCGNDLVPLLRASNKGRDLFVTFQSGPGRPNPNLYKGFSCFVRCLDKLEIPKALELIKYSIPKKRKVVDNCKCGSHRENHEKLSRMIGGQEVKINEYPFLVPIVIKGTRHLRCGGSIINSQFVLSAAHCFVAEDNPDLKENFDILVHARVLGLSFPAGEFPEPETMFKVPGLDLPDVKDAEENTQRYRVVEKIIHPLYSAEMDADIALLKLDRKINLGTPEAPSPICLPEHRKFDDAYKVSSDPYVNFKATIAGWGKSFGTPGAFSRLPFKLTNMPIIPYSVCKMFLAPDDDLTERMFCAGFLEGGKDSCQGDSGSPLFVAKNGEQFLQIGLNSWGDSVGCALKDSPGVYTDLRPFLQWIRFHISKTENVEWCKE